MSTHLGHYPPPKTHFTPTRGLGCDGNCEWIVIGPKGEEICHGKGLGGQGLAMLDAVAIHGWELPYMFRFEGEFVRLPISNLEYSPKWTPIERDGMGNLRYPTLVDIDEVLNPPPPSTWHDKYD